MKNKLLFLTLCILSNIYVRVHATNFAVGDAGNNEYRPKMTQRNGNLIIVGITGDPGSEVINITETTTGGTVVNSHNYVLHFNGISSDVVNEIVTDVIIDQDLDIVVYGKCDFGTTERPVPYVLKVDGVSRSLEFITALGSQSEFDNHPRGFTTSNIIEYHDGTGDYYYVAAVTYWNGEQDANGNVDDNAFSNGGFARLYVARIDYTSGTFGRAMSYLEQISQNSQVNVDHSNGGMMLASGNRIMVYGYYGNNLLTPNKHVRPYIYQVDPMLVDNSNNGILARYYFNSTGTDNAFREGIQKLVEIGSSNEFYMYGYDVIGVSQFRGIVWRVTLTPPAVLGDNAGTIALSSYFFKTNLDNVNESFAAIGDLVSVPGSNNILFSFIKKDVVHNKYYIQITSVNGLTGIINWSGYDTRSIDPGVSSNIVIIGNKIYCQGILYLSGTNDYYIFNPNAAADNNTNYGWDECYRASDVPKINPGWNVITSHDIMYYYPDMHSDMTVEVSRVYPDVTMFECSPCKAASSSSSSIVIADGTTISSDVTWGALGTGQKYYISGILTVDNALLDITNIDVIFAPCATIRFINNGRLRANNSVFRPCDENSFWRGLEFSLSINNKIESCVFKNASIALMFNSNATGNISNNQFFNCYIGIKISGSPDFNNPISENKFIVDRLLPGSAECINNALVSTCVGIWLDNALVSGDISQNQFVHNVVAPSTVQMWGIHSNISAFSASSNVFTNMYRAFEVHGEKNLVNPWRIINNTIELTKLYSGTLTSVQAHQVYITGYISNIGNEISKNTIRKTETQVLPYTAGIMIDPGALLTRISNVSVRENYVEGFNLGLYAISTANIMVTKNTFKDGTGIGVLFIRSNDMYISCNTIDMLNDLGTAKYGIDIANSNYPNIPGTPNNIPGKVHSNCIFNTEIAMFIYYDSAYLVASEAPEIRNNFLYNYRNDGILVRGMNAAIGTAASPGMNSFISNNNAAIDINFQLGSFGPAPVLTQSTNYSNKAFSFVGIPVPPNTVNTIKYSVASCAHQNQHMQGGVNFNGKYDDLLDCESTTPFVPPANPGGGETGGGGGPIGMVLQKSNGPAIMEMINSEKWAIGDQPKMGEWMSAINLNSQLDQESKDQAHYMICYRIQDINSMNALIDANKDHSDFFYLEAVKKGTEKTDSVKLLQIAEKGIYTQVCYFLLSSVNGQYRFNSSFDPIPDPVSASSGSNGQLTNLSIYPNPSDNNNISVDINMPGLYDFKTISIVDFMGMEVFSSEIYLMHGTTQLDISKLNAGVYYVVVKDENGKISTGKFVKL